MNFFKRLITKFKGDFPRKTTNKNERLYKERKGEFEDRHYELLKRVHSHQITVENPGIAKTLNLDAGKMLARFFELNLIKHTDVNDVLNLLTIPKLKEVLKQHGCKVSGRKQELIERIINEVPEETRNKVAEDNKGIIHTALGRQKLEDYKERKIIAKRNIELECIKLIKERRVNEAYRAMALYESQQPFQNGMSVPWRELAGKGLDAESLVIFNQMYTDSIPHEILCPTILGVFGGSQTYYLEEYFLEGVNEEQKKEYNEKIDWNTKVFYTKRKLLQYQAMNTKKYMIVVAMDERTCSVCSPLNNKRKLVSKAEIGVNCPPLHQGCRCTIVAGI